MENETKKPDEAGNLHKPLVMRSVAEIQARVIELNDEINNWTKERWKAKEQGYIDHCCEVISSFTGERNALKWVLGEQHYA